MGIKFNSETESWEAFFCKRHPITRMPVSRRRRGLKTQAAAQRAERELIAEIERLLHRQVIPTWSDVVERFLIAAKERGLTEHTIHDYATSLRAHTYPMWEERPVDQITTQEIRDLIEAKVGHRSPSHQKNVLKFIRAAFTHAVEIGVLNRNPSPKMKFRIGNKVKKVLTEEQLRTLLTKAKLFGSEWYPHWAMAAYTGMRSGELFALTWDKVNLEDRQILVNCSWSSKDGFKSTKSGDDRVLEIAPNLVTMLKELKLENGDSSYVLPRLSKWESGEQAQELAMFLTGIGLPVIRFHDLRATWATILLSKGVEPIRVMKMGGWKDMKTMMIYIRTAGVDIKGMTDCLDLHDPSIEPAKVLKLESRS